jgi:glyoxylase-like metal-dependent hydrolase (beta-lactamase superfamily II)
MRSVCYTALALVLIPGTGAAQARALAPGSPRLPRDIVARAVAAIGGDSALRSVRGVSIDFYTSTFALGQEETPASQARVNNAAGQTLTDYAMSRQVGTVEVRNPTGAVNELRRITAGGIGMLETNGRQAPDNPGTVASIEGGVRRALERVLIAALDAPATLTPLPSRVWRGEPHDGVRYANGPDTLNIYFARRTALPIVTETVTDDPILGDRHTVSWYTRWQAAGPILYPRQYDVEVNGRLQTHSEFTAVTVNPPAPDSLFAIPDSIASRAQRSNPTPPPVVVTLVELAPGVWRADGGSHHSLVVDQGTRLVVVEAPQSAARMQAVRDTLRSRFPGKPVGLVVNTHHHWDHAGGLRGSLAAGVPVVTHARNAAFVRGIAAAPKTVRPDALARRLGPARVRVPAITGVEDSLVLGAGERRVVVYRLPTTHVEGMLAAYVPAVRLLFVSDVLSPGPTLAQTGSAEVLAFARARGVTVDRVAGGHGGVALWADVERAASP